MGKVAIIGSMTCQEGKSEEMETVLDAMVEAARSEPGVEIYSYHRGADNVYWFFGLMADENAMSHHGQSAAMKEAMAAFGPLAAGPPKMSTATPIGAVGLDI